MKKQIAVLTFTFLSVIILAGCPSKPEPEAEPAPQKPLVVFLVRHAEKTDASEDPELSEEGNERANALAKLLASSNIEHVHSSDFARTRETAAPIAAADGLKVELYDPKDLATIAKDLRQTGGRHLVVGHSNTTPELTKLLGGDPGAAIDEKSEYDRLYVVTIGKDGTVNSVMLRYGKAFEKNKAAAAG